jgi:hypothetical protein
LICVKSVLYFNLLFFIFIFSPWAQDGDPPASRSRETITGMATRWGGLSRDQAHPLMVLHEGEWLQGWVGEVGESLYVLLNGLGLLWMLITGGFMAWERLQRGWRRRGGKGVT